MPCLLPCLPRCRAISVETLIGRERRRMRKKTRKKRKRENEPVRMISLETPRDTIEYAWDEVRARERARAREKERAKDIKSVSRATESEGGKAVTLQWKFQVFPPFEQRIIGTRKVRARVWERARYIMRGRRQKAIPNDPGPNSISLYLRSWYRPVVSIVLRVPRSV